ncbi:hypothetical protein TrRE_jg5929, partial [Triparma retinervis]
AESPDSYTHIAGRAGRAGREGTVISIVGYGDEGKIQSWRKMLGVEFEPVEDDEIGKVLISIYTSLFTLLWFTSSMCTKLRTSRRSAASAVTLLSINLPLSLPDDVRSDSYKWETYAFKYSVVWIAIFAVIVASQIYESFTHPLSYLLVCGTISLPYLLHPFLPSLSSPHSLRCTAWIASFSFIGNYFYTHYFYAVLGARYTFVGVRLNDVPVGMYFATHFYFTSYHALSNCLIRYIDRTYVADSFRLAHKVLAVFTMSYFTAFMESLTISHFPYYTFEDRESVYVVGSLFYAIYFFFSFPMFYHFSERRWGKGEGSGVWEAVVNSTSCGMMVLICLDFCRVALKVKFEMKV